MHKLLHTVQLYLKPAGVAIRLIIALLLGAAAGYAAEPDPVRYLDDSIPDHWAYNEHFNQQIPTDDNWWQRLDDTILDTLISRGVSNNYNLMSARHRIEVARMALNTARSGYLPTVAFSGSWTKQRGSGATGSQIFSPEAQDYFDLGLSMNWEIDIFGKVTAKARQQKASFNATRAEYAAAMTALCANIAKTYINLRVWQAQREVATEHIASQEKILKITEARHEAGLASMLDVTQARIVYYSTQASLPALDSSIHTGINALATLTGVYPDDIREALTNPRELPSHQQIVPIGVPMQLLRRRPDIVAAEYDLAAAAEAIGIAKRDFLPTLSLSGTIGTSAHDGSDLFSGRSISYSVAPTLSWTVFDGMRRRYNSVTARQQMEIMIDSYNNQVLTAVQEVDNAMSAYLSTLQSIDILENVVDQSGKSLDLSLDLYKRGLSPFNNVVTAQLNYLENQNSLVAARGKALTALIALYEALGGGWNATL